MNPRTLAGLVDELEKIAEAAKVEAALKNAVDTPQELVSKLRPGDVLFTAPNRKSLGYFWRFGYKPVSQAVQGTDYGHAALYTGAGKVMEARLGAPVKELKITRMLKKNNVVVMRPDVPEEEKKEAIEYARRMKGAKFDIPSIIRAALPLRGKREASRKPEETENVICSALVANAYARRKFSDSSRLMTRPSEVMDSSVMQPLTALARFNKPKEPVVEKG